MDSEEKALRSLRERAKMVAEHMVEAGQGLRVAQAKDRLRYARVHNGSYLPKLRRFRVGDCVYTKATTDLSAPDALKALARPEVLRVKEVRESRVLILQGRD
jgi:hypothetical protein